MIPQPIPGQLWRIDSPTHRHGVYLGAGTWKLLTRSDHGEYSLTPVAGPLPIELSPVQPLGPHWADEFDALARADGLDITWADEIRSYQQSALELLGLPG